MGSLTSRHSWIQVKHFWRDYCRDMPCVTPCIPWETHHTQLSLLSCCLGWPVWFQEVTTPLLCRKTVFLQETGKRSRRKNFGTLHILSSPSTSLPITLASLDDNCLNQPFHSITGTEWWFFYSIIFSTLISRNSSVKKNLLYQLLSLPRNSVHIRNTATC